MCADVKTGGQYVSQLSESLYEYKMFFSEEPLQQNIREIILYFIKKGQLMH